MAMNLITNTFFLFNAIDMNIVYCKLRRKFSSLFVQSNADWFLPINQIQFPLCHPPKKVILISLVNQYLIHVVNKRWSVIGNYKHNENKYT